MVPCDTQGWVWRNPLSTGVPRYKRNRRPQRDVFFLFTLFPVETSWPRRYTEQSTRPAGSSRSSGSIPNIVALKFLVNIFWALLERRRDLHPFFFFFYRGITWRSRSCGSEPIVDLPGTQIQTYSHMHTHTWRERNIALLHCWRILQRQFKIQDHWGCWFSVLQPPPKEKKKSSRTLSNRYRN